ncbi:MAG: M23 family metallopeptidase [Myxococcales bacterium]|nr:M23 family metallopeptidase [Myxococcales bacterium]
MRWTVPLGLVIAVGACGDEAAGGGVTAVTAVPPLVATAIFAPPVPHPEASSSTFGPRWKISAGRTDFHPGIDWFDAEGTPVTAIGDGVVEAVYPEGSTQFPLGGNVLAIRHELPTPMRFHDQLVDHVFAVYLHLQSIAVAAGQPITRGQVVAAMGQTGDTEFVHLHFELRMQTMCSLPYQTEHPDAGCVTGFDPHVHPFVFIPGPDADTIALAEIAPGPDAAYAVRYTATRGDLDLDAIATDAGALGFDERAGLDATSLATLDDFRYPWLTLAPQPFASTDDLLVMDLHFSTRPAFVEVRDLKGRGLRLEP